MSRKSSPALFRSLVSPATLDAAWDRVRSNGGCAGGDGETIEGFRQRAAKRLLDLSRAISTGEYRPRDLRVLHIPKRSGGTRPLAIPSVTDRIAQTAAAIVLTPVLDPTFSEASFAYRPGRSVLQAVRAVERWHRKGYEHVVEADIVRCFERIPHAPLLDRLDEAIGTGPDASRLSDLVAHWLEHAGLSLGTPGTGLAQGSPLSPLLANLYLDRIDDAVEDRRTRLVRFADDFIILCRSRQDAEQALQTVDKLLEEHALALRSDRTRIVDFDRGFDFLGHLFVRSMILRRVADPEEDILGTMQDQARLDADAVEEAARAAARTADEVARGYDRGERVLHVASGDRRVELRNLSFSVRAAKTGDEIIAVGQDRVDRIELGPDAEITTDAIRLALGGQTDIAFVDGCGALIGRLEAPDDGARAGLHMAQARLALDPERAAALARHLVQARLHNQRAQLHRLNRTPKDADVIVATKTLGRIIRKLPQAGDVAALRGHEGAAAAVYWPALGRLTAIAPQPFRRQRPAADPLNAAINYLTAMLARDVRAALLHAGLHPGFGVLHAAADRHDAAVWDLMEPFRAPLTEGLAVALFNQARLEGAMFSPVDGGIRIGRDGRKALITGYESAAGRVLLSPRSGRRRTWRMLMREEAAALAAQCRAPETDYHPFLLDS